MAPQRPPTEVDSLAGLLRTAIEGTERLNERIDAMEARHADIQGRIGYLEGMASGLGEARADARARAVSGEHVLTPLPAPLPTAASPHAAEPVRLDLWPPRAVGTGPVAALIVALVFLGVFVAWAVVTGIGAKAADRYLAMPPAAAVSHEPAPARAKE